MSIDKAGESLAVGTMETIEDSEQAKAVRDAEKYLEDALAFKETDPDSIATSLGVLEAFDPRRFEDFKRRLAIDMSANRGTIGVQFPRPTIYEPIIKALVQHQGGPRDGETERRAIIRTTIDYVNAGDQLTADAEK